jgi:thiol:disulfide interchange protein DsbA
MKRREFSMGLVAAAGASVAPGLAWAQTAGKDYLVLSKKAPVSTPAPKVEVVEFFSYGCVHCMHFEPQFESWISKAGPDVVVRREHVGFNAAFEPLQRLFYALEAMGQLNKVHNKIFAALQTDKIRMDQQDVAADWLAKQGVDKAKFLAAYKSFGVSTKLKQVVALQTAYAVEGTPAFGIAGKYYTDPSRAKGFPGMLQVADTLIAKERTGK